MDYKFIVVKKKDKFINNNRNEILSMLEGCFYNNKDNVQEFRKFLNYSLDNMMKFKWFFAMQNDNIVGFCNIIKKDWLVNCSNPLITYEIMDIESSTDLCEIIRIIHSIF